MTVYDTFAQIARTATERPIDLEHHQIEYRSVLQNFCNAISQGNVVAKLRATTDPNRDSIVLIPKDRPGFATILQSIFYEGSTLRFGSQVVQGVTELEQTLLDFINKSSTKQSLHEIHSIALAPVEANLRETQGLGKQLLVQVQPEDQTRLAHDPGPITLTVHRLSFSGNPTIDVTSTEQSTYKFLYSAGVVLTILTLTPLTSELYQISAFRQT
jgi:hypothetical protein